MDLLSPAIIIPGSLGDPGELHWRKTDGTSWVVCGGGPHAMMGMRANDGHIRYEQDQTGNLIITGITVPNVKGVLNLVDDANTPGIVFRLADTSYSGSLASDTTYAFTFYTTAVEKAFNILQNGRVLVNRTIEDGTGSQLQVGGSIATYGQLIIHDMGVLGIPTLYFDFNLNAARLYATNTISNVFQIFNTNEASGVTFSLDVHGSIDSHTYNIEGGYLHSRGSIFAHDEILSDFGRIQANHPAFGNIIAGNSLFGQTLSLERNANPVIVFNPDTAPNNFQIWSYATGGLLFKNAAGSSFAHFAQDTNIEFGNPLGGSVGCKLRVGGTASFGSAGPYPYAFNGSDSRATISLGEDVPILGRRASILFHNAGATTMYLEHVEDNSIRFGCGNFQPFSVSILNAAGTALQIRLLSTGTIICAELDAGVVQGDRGIFLNGINSSNGTAKIHYEIMSHTYVAVTDATEVQFQSVLGANGQLTLNDYATSAPSIKFQVSGSQLSTISGGATAAFSVKASDSTFKFIVLQTGPALVGFGSDQGNGANLQVNGIISASNGYKVGTSTGQTANPFVSGVGTFHFANGIFTGIT